MNSIRFLLIAFYFLQSMALGATQKHYLVLHEFSKTGLFANVYAVLGLLDYYEKGKDPDLAGLKVDFGKRGLYYDPDQGTNFWSYYFEPISICSDPSALPKYIQDKRIYGNAHCKDGHASNFCVAGACLSRRRAFELIQKYIKIKPTILEKVGSFATENFNDKYVIGVHYRGTDKELEVSRVSYEEVVQILELHIQKLKNQEYVIFIATDEDAFLQHMLNRYTKKIVYAATLHSNDGVPLHFKNRNNYQKGEEALIDCLLLSKCNHLIRTTASALSSCSTCFNPALSTVQVKAKINAWFTPYSTAR